MAKIFMLSGMGMWGGQNVVLPSITPNSSLSFKAKGLKIFSEILHINVEKVTKQILKFCPGTDIWRFFYFYAV